MITLVTILLIIVVAMLIRLFLFLQKNNTISQALLKRQKELKYINLLVTAATFENKSIEESFPVYLNTLREIVGWTYHSLFRLDEEKQVLPIRFTGYLPEWYMKDFSTKILVRVGDVSIGRAVSTKQPVTLNAAAVDPRFKDVRSLVGHVGYQSLNCCPIIGKLKTYGGFCTYSAYKNIFTLHDTQFLLTCSNLYAIILENKLLQKNLAQSSN